MGCGLLSRILNSLLGDLNQKFVYNFLDDLVLYSISFAEHIEHLKEIFMRLEKAGFTLNRDEVHLAEQEISFLRHCFSAYGIKILLERVEAIRGFPPPKKLKAVRRFLCMVCFYGRFMEGFPQISETLHLLKSKNVNFLCGDD